MFSSKDKKKEEREKMAVKRLEISEHENSGYIGKGMRFEGKLSFDGTVRIDGHFKGEINADGVIFVGEGALVEGNINVGGAVISGEVIGMVTAQKRVELQAPAVMTGDIKTPTLLIGEGVIFEGNCIMKKEKLNDNVNPMAGGSQVESKEEGNI